MCYTFDRIRKLTLSYSLLAWIRFVRSSSHLIICTSARGVERGGGGGAGGGDAPPKNLDKGRNRATFFRPHLAYPLLTNISW